MTREQIFTRLNEIFRDIFDDAITVTETSTADDLEDWDSFAHIQLVLAIEKDFGMKFAMDEVIQMKNAGAMADIIAERAVK